MLGSLNTETTKRFLAKVNKAGPVPEHRPDLGPCWLWTASSRTNGSGNLYGRFWLNGKDELAHRVSYQMFVDTVPISLTIDHLCRVTLCVNPRHIEPVTKQTNTLRGISPSAVNAKKVLCIRGHILTWRNDGTRRWCYACQDQRRKDRRDLTDVG